MGASRLHALEYQPVCRLLRQWREASGLTQRDMAVEMGLPPSAIHKCETGARRVDPVEFLRWALSSGVSAKDAAVALAKDAKLG